MTSLSFDVTGRSWEVVLAGPEPSDPDVERTVIRLPLREPVARHKISQYPGKIVVGDSTRDSRPRTSLIAYTDWRGGIGIEHLLDSGDEDRVNWSTCDLSFAGHMVLPPRADDVPKPVGVERLLAWAELGNLLYGVFRSTSTGKDQVYQYDGASWGTSLHTLLGRFNSIAHVEIEGDDHLVIAHADGVAYSSGGSTWTDTGPVV